MATWIPVLVRLEDYAEITAQVAAREAARPAGQPITPFDQVRALGHLPPASPPATPEAKKLAAHIPWDVEDLARLAEGRTTTTQRWTRALDVMVDAEPGTWLPTSDVARRSGMTINEWRDAPRKIARHLQARYPNVPKDENPDAYWPLASGGGASRTTARCGGPSPPRWPPGGARCAPSDDRR